MCQLSMNANVQLYASPAGILCQSNILEDQSTVTHEAHLLQVSVTGRLDVMLKDTSVIDAGRFLQPKIARRRILKVCLAL